VIGSGLGKRLASVHWGKAGQMASGWVLTIPGAALIGAGAWEGAHALGTGSAGPILIGVVAAAVAATLYLVAQRAPVRAGDLDRTRDSAAEGDRASSGAAAAVAQT
jgi:PiT family inorganic phosphate transporter